MNIGVAFGMQKLAASLQGDGYFKPTIAGGARRSNWLAGIVLATVVAVVTAIVVILSALRSVS